MAEAQRIRPKRGKKKRSAASAASKGLYFVKQSNIEFVSSGCAVLDCVLGGGYPLGRITNIVGDKSTGKTLLAMEGFANFTRQYEDGLMWYLEAEAAFDEEYARSLGIPIDQVTFVDEVDTVEKFERQLKEAIDECQNRPGIFVVDSLDALSDEAEQAREIEKGTYGGEKPKQMSRLFRKLTRRVEQSRLLLVIISQIRDNVGALYGRKWRRSGGRALDFYSSQILVLKEKGKIKRTVRGITRPVGVQIEAATDKCKVGLPYRDCYFEILFGYGVDSVKSNLLYLQQVGKAKEVDSSLTTQAKVNDFVKKVVNNLDEREYRQFDRKVAKQVRQVWSDVEMQFLTNRRKY